MTEIETSAAVALDEVLAEFAKHRNWELSFDGKMYCEDDNPDLWTVWRVSGGINDREWSAIGRGKTPAEAIEAAALATQATTTQETK